MSELLLKVGLGAETALHLDRGHHYADAWFVINKLSECGFELLDEARRYLLEQRFSPKAVSASISVCSDLLSS